MAATVPPIITPPGLVPDYNDRGTFGPRVLAWDLWVRDHMVSEVGAAVANAYQNAIEAFNQAQAAATSASQAAAILVSNGITVWVSVTTYAINSRVTSPLNGRIYSRRVAGAGTTDPSLDATNWAIWSGGLVTMPVTANMTAQPGFHYYMTGAYTLSMPAVGTLIKDDRIKVSNASLGTAALVSFGSTKVRGRTVPPDGTVRLDTLDMSFEVTWTGDTTYGWI